MISDKELADVLDKFRPLTKKGKVADYIPELALVNPDYLAVAIVKSDGSIVKAGDTDISFALESISKTAALALCLADNGEDKLFEHVHKEPSGDPFNSIVKLELSSDHLPKNPLINAGAIMTTSLIKGSNPDDVFDRLLAFMQNICQDNSLKLDSHIYLSERSTGDINRALAYFMKGKGVLGHAVVEDVLDVYFRQCSVLVNVVALANLARFFASGGLLTTGERVISSKQAKIVTGLMATCGLYDQSGQFLDDVGLPGKSGVGGGIICPVPNKKMGIAVFSPALDEQGNSLAGIEILKYLCDRLDLNIF